MKALAVIPARGGSKRLPRKNLKMLGDKPLVAHTLAAAQESGCFADILLSSDDDEILSQAAGYPDVHPLPRPERLSGDHVTALELVCEIIDSGCRSENYDVIALLLPTAPFRTAAHVRAGFKLLTDDVDGVVSLTTYEFPPQLSVRLDDGIISPVFDPCPLITGNTRSQDQQPIYRPNGGFYIQWMKKFVGNRNFWKGKVRGYSMGREDSADIDTEQDLRYAQHLMENRA
jgi:CMP-N-acetylneuraminic acid synthetase